MTRVLTGSLFLALVAAKLAVIYGHGGDASARSLVVHFAQDAMIVLAFLAFTRGTRRWPSWARGVHAVLVGHVALNLGVALATGSSLTAPMFRAAGGAMTDSFTHMLRASIVGPVLAVLAIGVVGQWCALRWAANASPKRPETSTGRKRATGSVPIVVGLIVIAIVGTQHRSSVATRGLHASAPVALVRSFFPRIESAADARDWRQSPLEGAQRSDRESMPFAASPLHSGVARGRNLVVIVLESVGAGYLQPYGAQPYGAASDPMPHLTRLAADSWQFDAAYAVYPESIKGFLPLLASEYPAFETTAASYERPLDTWPDQLARNGYTTALYHSGRFDYLGMRSIIEQRGFDRLVDAADISGVYDSSFGVDEFSTVDRMLDDLDAESDDRPFCFAYLPVAGHHPYDAPEPGPFGAGNSSAADAGSADGEFTDYLNALHYADRAIDRLLDGLAERGMLDNTVVAVVGDHGQAFAQHPGNRGHIFFLYEENLHVPLWIHAPGLTSGGLRSTTPTSVIDLAPTLLDLLGVARPTSWQGRSLLGDSEPRVALFFTDYALPLVGARDGRWKVIHDLDSGRTELFDLSRDPRESDNLASQHPEITRRLRDHVVGWVRDQKARHEIASKQPSLEQ